MCLEGSAERKVFSACVPAVEEILTFIPSSQWLCLRCVIKFMKRVIDRKLISVEKFPWVPKKTDRSFLDEAFYFVRNMTPNLKELPPFLEDRILLGGFTNVRRLTIRGRMVLVFGFDAYIKEIHERAPVLESLKFESEFISEREGMGKLLVNVFPSGCYFGSLKKLDMCDAAVVCSIFPADIISSLPVLEHLSFPTCFNHVGFAQDFQKVAGLPNLKVLEGCAERGKQVLPPTPSELLRQACVCPPPKNIRQ